MKRILVHFDGSDSARRAFEHALQKLAPQHNAWIHLLNVQLPLVEPWPARELGSDDIHAELERPGLVLLAEAEAHAASMSIPCELEVRIGHPADEILAAVSDNRCHEIVVGVEGSPLGQLQRLKALAPVPVTLVH